MPDTPAEELTQQFTDGVDTAAKALKAAASSTHALSEEASEVLANATTEISKLAESLRVHALGAAKDAVQYAKSEAKAHPIASLAAALTAVVAVMSLLAVNRRS